MTIKEVEQCLNVPRATIRFYEKEGLLSPMRGENRYREYSEEDVVLLKKIIILRKVGFSVADIEDVLDGARPMWSVLESNMENLARQMQELQGALTLCRKMQENGEQIETFDADKYWNAVEEEERKGNRFLDIAKDVAKFEKVTLLEYFGIEHCDGKMADGFLSAIMKVAALPFGFCGGWCLMEWLFGDFNEETFRDVVFTWLAMLIIEIVVAIPTYFFLKKHPNAKKKKVQAWMLLGMLGVLLVVLMVVKVIK